MFWFGLIIGALMVLAIVMLATPIKLRATWSGDTQKVVIRYLGFGRTTDFLGKTRTFDWLGLRLSEKPAGPKGLPPHKTGTGNLSGLGRETGIFSQGSPGGAACQAAIL